MDMNLTAVVAIFSIIVAINTILITIFSNYLKTKHQTELSELKRKFDEIQFKYEKEKAKLEQKINFNQVLYDKEKGSLEQKLNFIENQYKSAAIVFEQKLDNIKANYERRAEYLTRQVENLEKDRQHYKGNLQQKSNELNDIQQVGIDLFMLKTNIEQKLLHTMDAINATASSICVPNQLSRATDLIFLCAHGPVGNKLYKVKIPVSRGIVGKVYRTGEIYLCDDLGEVENFYSRIDTALDFQSRNVIAIPIKKDDQTIAVVEFLNKKEELAFNRDDVNKAKRFSEDISELVSNFFKYPDYLRLLGIKSVIHREEANVLFFDITNSRVLRKILNIENAIHYINEFFNKMCSITFRYGAAMHKTMGDCALLTFSLDRNLKITPLDTVKEALEMSGEFEKMRQVWRDAGIPIDKVYIRIGIEHGYIEEVIVGHPRKREFSIAGDAVNVASILCRNANRMRNTIYIGENFYNQIAKYIDVQEIPIEKRRRSQDLITKPYELLGVR